MYLRLACTFERVDLPLYLGEARRERDPPTRQAKEPNMSLPNTPVPGSRGRGGNFRPLVIRGIGEPRIQVIALNCKVELGEAVYAALASGQGILMSATRDMGAVSVILYGPGDPQQTYCSSQEELEEALQAVRERSASLMARATPTPLNGRVAGS